MSEHDWYWDLKQAKAVRAPERDKADHLLGPYKSQEEAEHWKERVEARNESWKEADEAWAGDDDEGDDTGQAAGGGGSASR